MKKIAVVTVARSDYGIYQPLLKALTEEPGFDFYLLVSGMHLSQEFGMTVNKIKADGFPIRARIESLLSSDTPEGIGRSMGLGLIGFAQEFSCRRPDLLIVLGDRYDMYVAGLAALPFGIPVAHIHGGELTFGAIDDALRHSLTKISHLHFVSTDIYAQRVIQLGEESWRVHVTGALSLDNLNNISFFSPQELEKRYAILVDPPPLLVTFHPVTLEYEEVGTQADELLAAVEDSNIPVVFTLPNADTGGRVIIRKIERFVKAHSHAFMVENFGTRGYFSMMKIAAAMVGNSSSGILEAASFGLPVVNVGSRQDGRVRAANVIDVECCREDILEGIKKVVRNEFKDSIRGLPNLYGGGNAAPKILHVLRTTALDQRLLKKPFYDKAETCT
ncbi:UDP-N-acetylglucosamine 2-epimerase [Thermodesulfobacteriota bacterium]